MDDALLLIGCCSPRAPQLVVFDSVYGMEQRMHKGYSALEVPRAAALAARAERPLPSRAATRWASPETRTQREMHGWFTATKVEVQQQIEALAAAKRRKMDESD